MSIKAIIREYINICHLFYFTGQSIPFEFAEDNEEEQEGDNLEWK